MTDAHRLETVEQLRAVIGESFPGLDEKNIPTLDAYARDFIARAPFLVLSTASAAGAQDASPKGDGPGFVEVVSDTELLIPDRPGNKLAYGNLNILENPRVGLLFMIPGTPETLRINGSAELTCDPQVLSRLEARGKPAVLAIRVHVEECFFHCAKAFMRSRLWDPESWGERHRVSFGEMFAARRALGADAAEQVNAAVEADYESNL